VSYDLPAELTVAVDGAVRVVVINRPSELNAINQPLHRALALVWAQLAADADAKVARDESLREGAQIIEEMLRFPLPVIAAVNGAAVGLGCSLAVLSDVALISESAYLADPHVSVGLVAGDGGAAFWPLLTPILRSREYLLTGDRIKAATAVELGLATRTTRPDELLPEARRLAGRLAAQSAEALRGTKRVVNMHLSRALSGEAGLHGAAEAVSMQSAEHRERLLALRRAARYA
jgi:enoyl-CoA hydratase